ncbi:MAG: CPBP family intramembrane metalloprotease [Candidatus Aminicenantes bacterium]|nr:CPBP family intramembrane metalloprotease [Candidatus Aminicenantes bacterium]
MVKTGCFSAHFLRFTRNDKMLKSSILVFMTFYALALIVRAVMQPASLPLYLLMDAGLAGFAFLIVDLTKKRELPADVLADPFIEMAFAFMVLFALMSIVPRISLPWWDVGQIINKNIRFVVPVVLMALFFKSSIQEWKIVVHNFWKDALLGIVVLACLLVPSIFYSGSLKYLASHRLSVAQLAMALGVGFVHSFFGAALPEELFYRGLIQRRLSVGLRSPWSGVLLAALFFGIAHSSANASWGFGKTFFDGFAEAVLVQSFLGLIFGVLYLRTRNLFLCMGVHAFINASTSIAFFAGKLGL